MSLEHQSAPAHTVSMKVKRPARHYQRHNGVEIRGAREISNTNQNISYPDIDFDNLIQSKTLIKPPFARDPCGLPPKEQMTRDKRMMSAKRKNVIKLIVLIFHYQIQIHSYC